MNRKPFGIALVLLCVAGPVHAQFDDVEITSTRLADGVYMLEGRGGNLGVSTGPDGVLLIDDQFAPLTEKIEAAVKQLGGGEIRFVVNTHWHGDHTGGNENMGKAGAVIVAHDNVRERMSTEQFNVFRNRPTPPSPAAALPVVTFADGVTFHFNGETIQVLHVASAHTDGDSIVRFHEANVLHLGDVYFNGLYPFIDIDSGGSIDGLIAAVESALELADDETRIIPGHGPVSSRAEFESYRDMLVKSRSGVAALKQAGKSLEQAVAARPTAEFDEALGGSFIDPEGFVTAIYKSLSR